MSSTNKKSYSFYFNYNFPENNLNFLEKRSNKISTSIYNWYNFMPKIIIQQFSKYANLYFLLIMLMQVIC